MSRPKQSANVHGARLGDALRANLVRRKDQARARDQAQHDAGAAPPRAAPDIAGNDIEGDSAAANPKS